MFTIDKLKYALKSEKEEFLYFIGLIQETVGQVSILKYYFLHNKSIITKKEIFVDN